MSTIARLMGVNFFAKSKTNVGNLPLSLWKTIETLKKARFQNLNFTSKPKGYIKIAAKADRTQKKKEKSDEAKRRSKFFKLEKGKVC